MQFFQNHGLKDKKCEFDPIQNAILIKHLLSTGFPEASAGFMIAPATALVVTVLAMPMEIGY